MISMFQALIIGLVQGLTELFPISSLGHSVIIPQLLGWNIHQNDAYFLTFLVTTHLATAAVLFAFFWHDWVLIIKGLLRSLRTRHIGPHDTYAKLGWLLVVATIPAAILGLLLQHSLQRIFASAQIASFFLIINGVILYGAEKLRKVHINKRETKLQGDQNIANLSYGQSVGIGLAQSAALLAGISRSGASMAGSLLAGLNNIEAARFSFLLATPIIAAASILKLPSVFTSSMASLRPEFLVGALSAALAAYLSVKFLVKYFETRTLTPFAIYCFVAGIIYSLYFLVK